MKIYKEKVLGTRGNLVVRGRVVEFNTAQTGHVRRAELVLEDLTIPGQPKQDLGWSVQDIENIHRMLVNYIKETGEDA